MASIVILGGGFGGLLAAQNLARLLDDSQHRITLISPQNTFTIYPSLVRFAFGECEPDEIAFDLVKRLDDLDVRYVQGEAIRINTQSRRLRVAGNDFDGEIYYDYLIVAAGRRLATEKVKGFFEYSHHLLDVRAATKFGQAVRNFKSGNIIVGLAPGARLPVPACEAAFELAKMFAPEIAEQKISLNLVFPETIREAFGGADVHLPLERAFRDHKIHVIENFAVREIDAQTIISGENQNLAHDLLMLIPPFRGRTILGLDAFLDEFGFLKTDNFMRICGLEKVYAVGDMTAFPGPKLAFMAIRQAQVAAENIASELKGDSPGKIYNHDLAVIIDEAGEKGIFLHYEIWNQRLWSVKEDRMWSRLKKSDNYLQDLTRVN